MCGCRILRETDAAPPEGATAKERRQAREQREAFARRLQERWGCPAAGHREHAELPTALRDEAALAARVLGLPAAPTTCPFACVERPDPWVLEILDAVGLATECHVPIAESLGRDPSAADLDAVAEVMRARGAAQESDWRIREQERERERERTKKP